MILDKKILAIIPARSGSKRLPRKNVLDFAGKPLIAWTIEAARKSRHIDRVIVSTDSPEIAKISEQFGAEVPFLRPERLADDSTTTIEVVIDAIDKITEKYDYIILLQPTSPLRDHRQIDESIERLGNNDSVVSVVEVEHPIEWCNTLPEDGSMDNFLPPHIKNTRSQDLPVRYRINGAIYIARTERLVKEGSFLLETGSYAYKMDKKHSVDIDDKEDFEFALSLRQLSEKQLH